MMRSFAASGIGMSSRCKLRVAQADELAVLVPEFRLGAQPLGRNPVFGPNRRRLAARETTMAFEFQVIQSVEVFRDPIGHYRHWTIVVGNLIAGTMHLHDPICIPAVDGTKMCARIGGFEAFRKDPGSQVSAGQLSDPLGVMVCSPAPGQREIAVGMATGSSPAEFHELIAWTLRHKPARLIHDRGPDGLGLPCPDCTRLLFTVGPVLHADFELTLRDLRRHPDPTIAGRAQDIISKSMSEADYNQLEEQQKATGRKPSVWKFWKRK